MARIKVNRRVFNFMKKGKKGKLKSKVRSALKTIIPVEMKDSVFAQNNIVAANNLVLQNLSILAQGTDSFQRIGRKTQVKYIKLRCGWTATNVVDATIKADSLQCNVPYVRVFVFQDYSYDPTIPNTPLGPQLFSSYSVANGLIQNAISSYNTDYVYEKGFANKGVRYKMLYDSGPILMNNPLNSTYSDRTSKCRVKTIKVKKPTFYNTAVSTDTSDGTIWLGWFQGVSTTAANNPTFSYHARLIYSDD